MNLFAATQLLLTGAAVAALPLGWVWARGDADKYRALIWIATFLTLDLIMFGGFTRLTDSGLGCPDWPGCYGHSTPVPAWDHLRAAEAAMPGGPVTVAKAWIEMLHRYFAMGVGALILTLAVLAWRGRHAFGRSPWPATGLLVLVIVQGAFGAFTVTLKLMPLVVTIHLLLGIALLCALGMLVGFTRARPLSPDIAGSLGMPARIALAVLFVQIALGGWVSTNYAVLACQGFPACNGSFLPDADFARGFDLTRPLGLNDDGSLLPVEALVAIHWVHRTFAYVVVAVLGWLVLRLVRAGEATRGFAWAIGALLALQVATGIANVVLAWPLAIAVAHNGGAAALALALALLNSRLPADRRSHRSAPAPAGA
jgi:cytochrome c oxidase assembly protein subunit 15